MARSERGASPQRAVTTERRSQSLLCLAPSTVALILALAFVARLAEIALDIGATLRALANAKIHSNAAHSNISTGSQCSIFCSPPSPLAIFVLEKSNRGLRGLNGWEGICVLSALSAVQQFFKFL